MCRQPRPLHMATSSPGNQVIEHAGLYRAEQTHVAQCCIVSTVLTHALSCSERTRINIVHERDRRTCCLNA